MERCNKRTGHADQHAALLAMMIKRPTSVRWLILSVLFLVSTNAYVQRMNINVAGKFMMTELGLTQVQLGWVISAFIAGYTLFQFPGGIFGQRLGPRHALTLCCVAWGVLSVFSGLVPATFGVGVGSGIVSLLILRFLMGAAHGPLFPVQAGAIAQWFPPDRWALPNALLSTGLTVGAAATPPVVAWLCIHFGWLSSFLTAAPISFAVAGFWWWYGRDNPAQHSAVNADELECIQATRLETDTRPVAGAWKLVLRDRQIWLLTCSYFCMNYVFYFFYSWFFIYLVDERGFTLLQGGFAASAPWLVGAVAATAGGATVDRLCRQIGPRWGCRSPCVVALLLVAVLLCAGAWVEHPYLALIFLSLCFGFTQFTEGAYWSGAIYVAGDHTATATGILNTGGNLVGILSTPFVAWLASTFGAVIALASGALFALLAATLWLFIRVDEPMLTARDSGPSN